MVNNHTAVHTVACKIVHDQCTRACCGIGVVSGAVPTGKVDVEGRRHCKCLDIHRKNCLESSAMLLLHSVSKMPQKVYQRGASAWKTGPEAYICNSHYDRFERPTQAIPFIVPILFKTYQKHTRNIPEYQNRIKSINNMYKT